MGAEPLRVERLRRELHDSALHGAIITDSLSRRYLSGFTGTGGWLLVTLDGQFLLTDSRYWEQAPYEAPEWRLVKATNERGSSPGALKELLQGLKGCRKLAVEADSMCLSLHQALTEHLAFCALTPVSRLVERLRATKDAGEAALARQAARLCEEAFLDFRERIRPGVTDRELIVELDCALRRCGVTPGHFDTIVAAGPDASRPHARGTGRPLREGDMLLVDFGGTFGGYHADMTRTFPVGAPDGKLVEIYKVVRDAQARAIAAVRPGVTCEELDGIARNHIRDAGYGDFFGHSLGHGLGLAIHEEPWIRRANPQPLEAGMLFTVEPGIYVPGLGGVRIEDMVLVTDGRPELLTSLPYEEFP